MNKMDKIVLAFLLFMVNIILPSHCNARNYYVKTDGIPRLTGSSWSWATPELQGAIEKASAGDTVFVAAGKYYGGFMMKEGVNVFGGYTANNSNPAERYSITDADSSHYSTLDGENKQRVLTQLLPFTVPTTWDGFVIQHGNSEATFKKGSIIYSQTGDNKIIGILFQYQTETETGKMIGLREIPKQWGGYENIVDELQSDINDTVAKTNLTGVENTEKIVGELAENSVDFSTTNYSNNANYAAFWCDTLTEGGYTEWYLPAPGELQEVFDANIQGILKNVGKDLRFPFWTSGQAGNTLAWSYCFGNGNCHPALKYVNYPVSAAHNFSAPEQPNSIYSAGGGVFLSANGILQNCTVSNNKSSSKGGGIYVGKDGQVLNCIVENNNAPESKNIYYEVVSGVDKTHSLSFNIYPNPVHAGQEIKIDNPEFKTCDYLLIDASGKTISTGKLEDGTLSVPQQKGIYILFLQSGKINLSKKFIIK